ncbi:hypothetical protein T01_8141 [Trichinella spiralis]|uniref:Uncharacterized protein n=1 Tax=Trichinella spiralis TaxID=6334 RepID=A0A0V1BRD3_TRISP|nr:hypothetical protein T01_8141 [Trichinella spiralis]
MNLVASCCVVFCIAWACLLLFIVCVVVSHYTVGPVSKTPSLFSKSLFTPICLAFCHVRKRT